MVNRKSPGLTALGKFDTINTAKKISRAKREKARQERTANMTNMIKCYIMDTDANKNVGKHFKVKEFACKDGSQAVFIDSYMVDILEILRQTIGKPINVTSGYRTPEHNKRVGGAKYSYHMRGCAADVVVKGMKPKEVAKTLDKIAPDSSCGIIVEKSWVHFDTRNSKYRKGV